MINGLGSGFEGFVASISQHYRRKEDISFDELVSQLFDEHRRKAEEDKDPVALVSHSGRPIGNGRVPTCWHCGKVGHIEPKCFLKHPELRP